MVKTEREYSPAHGEDGYENLREYLDALELEGGGFRVGSAFGDLVIGCINGDGLWVFVRTNGDDRCSHR